MSYQKIFTKLTFNPINWLLICISLHLTGCATQPTKPPNSGSVIPTPPIATTKPPISIPPSTYRVMPGEGLYAIASRYGLDYRIVAEWNGITPPYNIHPGQILRLSPDVMGNELKARDLHSSHRRHHNRNRMSNDGENLQPAPNEGALPADSTANNWNWPTQGRIVRTFIKGKRTRQGIRIAGIPGQEIVAAASGRVIYSGGGLPGYGQLIIIKHAKNYLSVYGFNSKIFVQEGVSVTKGERIAEMGYSTDGKPMLHFEIRRGEVALNPLRLLPRH